VVLGAALQGSEWPKHETGHPFKTNAKVQNAISFIHVFSTHTHTHPRQDASKKKAILPLLFRLEQAQRKLPGSFQELILQKISAIQE